MSAGALPATISGSLLARRFQWQNPKETRLREGVEMENQREPEKARENQREPERTRENQREPENSSLSLSLSIFRLLARRITTQ